MVYADQEQKHATQKVGRDRRAMDPEYRENRNAYQREYRKTNPYQVPGRNRRVQYGVTPSQYQAMVIAQCGACAICGVVPSENPDANPKVSRLVIDHDHTSGVVRALLCSRCNLMLGQSRDNPARLEVGAAYLREFQ